MDRRQQTWQRTEFDLGLVLLLAFGVAAIIFVVWPYPKRQPPWQRAANGAGPFPLFCQAPSYCRARPRDRVCAAPNAGLTKACTHKSAGNVRFRGQSGHRKYEPPCPLFTAWLRFIRQLSSRSN